METFVRSCVRAVVRALLCSLVRDVVRFQAGLDLLQRQRCYIGPRTTVQYVRCLDPEYVSNRECPSCQTQASAQDEMGVSYGRKKSVRPQSTKIPPVPDSQTLTIVPRGVDLARATRRVR